MSFEIYFDESLKIDKRSSYFSFYGIIGLEYKRRRQIEEIKNKIGFRSEFHFSDFKISHIDYYLSILRESMDLIETKIYVVDTEFAFESAKRLSINSNILRRLFYVKIPERLIYGMTRYLKEPTDIDIYIDKSEEYGNDDLTFLNDETRSKLERIIKKEEFSSEKKCKEIEILASNIYNHVQLTKTLKEQLNAQSLYRDLNFKVRSVKQKKSNESICLQISDVILGILGFLFEEKYLDMPPDISEEKMKIIRDLDCLTQEEKDLLRDSYKYNEKNKVFNLKVKQEDLNTIKKLRELNKKTKVYSAKNISRSEFVYRAILDKNILNKLHDINIFMWPSKDNDSTNYKVDKMFYSHYISSFLNFKYEFDNKNKNNILKFHNDSINIAKYGIDDYTNCLGIPLNLYKITDRYLKELNIEIKQ